MPAIRSRKSLRDQTLVNLSASNPVRLWTQQITPSSQEGFAFGEGDSQCLSALKTIVASNAYDLFMSAVIMTNSVVLVIETDRSVNPDAQPADWLDAMAFVFLTIYILDVACRAYIQMRMFFVYTWNLIDAVLVVSDVVAIFMSNTASLAPMRLVRVLRMVRVVRLLKLFKELHIMLYGLVSTVKAIAWSVVMLALVLTFQSVVFVQFLHPVVLEVEKTTGFGDCTWCKNAFNSVMECNLTIVMTVVAGDSWGLLARPLIEKSPLLAGSLLIGSLLTISLGLLNLILTVIVNAAQRAHDDDLERKFDQRLHMFDAAKIELLDMCCKLDLNGTGDLTLPEIKAGFAEEGFAKIMSLLDMQISDIELVFSILDEDRSGTVTYTEFVEQLHKMKSQDTHTMLVFIKGYVNELRLSMQQQLRFMKEELHASISALHDGLIPKKTKTTAKLHDSLEITSTTPSTDASLPKQLNSAHFCTKACEPQIDLGGVPQDVINLLGELNQTLQRDLKQVKEQLNVDVESLEQIKERWNVDMKRMLAYASETEQRDAGHSGETSGSQNHDTKYSDIEGSTDAHHPAPINELPARRSEFLSRRVAEVVI